MESELEATLLRYQHESSNFGVRLAQVKQEEAQLAEEKKEFVNEKKLLQEQYDKLHIAAKEIKQRSKDIEEFAVVNTNYVLYRSNPIRDLMELFENLDLFSAFQTLF